MHGLTSSSLAVALLATAGLATADMHHGRRDSMQAHHVLAERAAVNNSKMSKLAISRKKKKLTTTQLLGNVTLSGGACNATLFGNSTLFNSTFFNSTAFNATTWNSTLYGNYTDFFNCSLVANATLTSLNTTLTPIDITFSSVSPSSSSASSTAAATTATTRASANVPASTMTLVQSHSGNSFLNGWDFFTSSDPTHGMVNFLSQSAAQSAGLVSSTANTFTMKVDDTTTLGSGQYRNSVRITSKQSVKMGSLILFDATHIPHGASVWPAFWTVGTNWPNNGEIDIVEQVNSVSQNQYTLHTSAGCTVSSSINATGSVLVNNCDVAATGNAGCGIRDPSTVSYGPAFGNNGGGTYATIYAADGISIWFFPRNQIPDDITAGQPNPDRWGKATARFDASTCDIDRYFGDQTIVINITLCGDWAGSVTPGCSAMVADPANYRNAYWGINYVKVYTL